MDNNNIGLYPTPPRYFKSFTRPDSFMPPDLSIIGKFGSFTTFGKEYSLKKISKYDIAIESDFLNYFDRDLIESYNIPNQNLFNNPKIDFNKITLDSLNLNVMDVIQDEISFIKRMYIELLQQIRENIDKCELISLLIKYSFQKVYFLISLVKRKKVWSDIFKYFKGEMEYNDKLENTLSNNIHKFINSLQSGLTKIKEDISSKTEIR